MSALLGWGSGYYEGDNGPHTAPFLTSNAGAVTAAVDAGDHAYNGFRDDNFVFGVAGEVFVPATATITYLPAGGGPAVVTTESIGEYGVYLYLHINTPGLFEITATADGVEIPNKLVVSVSPPIGNGGNEELPSMYGSVSWYQAALTAPAFWTQLVNALEIRN